MRFEAATCPFRHPGNGHPEPVSTIPAHVRATCDVHDIVWDTHRDHVATAKWAHARDLPVVLDFETQRAAMDTYYFQPERFKQNLAARGAMLKKLRRMCPGIDVGVYDVCKIGLARNLYKLREFVEYLRAEDKQLNSAPRTVIEMYVDNLDPADATGMGGFDAWAAGFDLLVMGAAAQGATHVDLLLSPLYGVAGRSEKEWVYKPDLFDAQLAHVEKEAGGPSTALKITPSLWPWVELGNDFAPGAWDIVARYSRRPARDTVPGGAD